MNSVYKEFFRRKNAQYSETGAWCETALTCKHLQGETSGIVTAGHMNNHRLQPVVDSDTRF